MPELPEVETTVRGIIRYAKGKRIVDVWTDYNSPFHTGKDNIKNPKYFSRFRKNILDTRVVGASRRAKNVLIHLSNGWTIVVHMKMTGHIMYGKFSYDNKRPKDKWKPINKGPFEDPFNKFIRLVLIFSDKSNLVLSDMRKFAKVHLIKTSKIEEELGQNYGPEPLEKSFTFEKFKKQIFKKSDSKIKPTLMDQTVIAGIGNIYSDEILWRVGVHPEERVSKIPPKKILEMFKAMKEVLRKGIDLGGDSMSDYRNIKGEKGKFQEHHRAYRRTGKPCGKAGCKGKIIRKKVAGRSAHFCDTHQKLLTH